MARVLITGASGFVGQNLVLALENRTDHEVIPLTRESSLKDFHGTQVDHIIHLAGANRPATDDGFTMDNVDYVDDILACFRPRSPSSSFHYASSSRYMRDDPYGRSKKAGEERVVQLAPQAGWSTAIWRLPNLFGKWCKPNYNSFIATFIDQAIRNEEFSINDPAASVDLLYVDDLIDLYLGALATGTSPGVQFVETFATTRTTVGEVAEMIDSFRRDSQTTLIPDVGNDLRKQLHATYLSHLDQDARVFNLNRITSDTGSFCELFKADSYGQVSVLTIEPGASRGNHFHDTKCENFHLAQGRVELIERDVRGGETLTRVVQTGQSFWTRPGWIHTLINVGDGTAVLLIWANEVFDEERPDTFRLREAREKE
ncbi:NAD-dependent epimerase/dehydratase family protein [Rhodobacteraceae bacterium M385]|nr:NAD-dependent epimerase/dehydratase family protein [Rhodobacteraceae bacterium M385]